MTKNVACSSQFRSIVNTEVVKGGGVPYGPNTTNGRTEDLDVKVATGVYPILVTTSYASMQLCKYLNYAQKLIFQYAKFYKLP